MHGEEEYFICAVIKSLDAKIMNILSAREVKKHLEENPQTFLIMTLQPAVFAKGHIPGSINIWRIDQALELIPQNAQIIVYCSDRACRSSFMAYQLLEKNGYQHIWRFAGGLVEWTELGYPLRSISEKTL